MKVQPIDPAAAGLAPPPPAKSRLKRLFERQFQGVLRISPAERLPAAAVGEKDLAGGGEVEPSSVCLDRMVRSFLEESAEKPSSRCGRRCNCFHGDASDDDDDFFAAADSSGDAADLIKGLVHCASLRERNLLADVAAIVEKHKHIKRKHELLKLVAEALRATGYDAAVCKSRWDKTPSYPAGEYEFVDVVYAASAAGGGGERLLVDVDFRSEFEIARSTKAYRAVLQWLPVVFVGDEGRLRQIVAAAAEAAKASLKKKGLHFPPWRKPEYMRAKWLSSCDRQAAIGEGDGDGDVDVNSAPVSASPTLETERSGEAADAPWELPPAKSLAPAPEKKVITGLASVFKEKA